MEENFLLDLVSALDQSRSQKRVNADIKTLEKTINMLRLTATLAKGSSKKEINAYIKTLSDQLSTIKLKAKIDSKNLKSEINSALSKVSFKDIDVLNIDGNRTKLKAQKVIADTKAYIEKNPINIGINYENRRNKLDNDLTAYLNRHTKISESSVLLKEADKVRNLIGAINDKKSLREATDAFQLYRSEVSATGFNTKSTTDKIKDMLSHVTKISSALGVATMLLNNFTKSMKTLRENDTVLTEISKTSELTKNQLRELGDEAFKTASKYGQLSSNYLLGVQEMARSGYEDMSKELGELSLLAQSAGDMTADSANNYLLATDAAYKYGGSIEKLNVALDGANYISNKNSAALTDIADATRVSASFAANAGIAIDELTAAEAAMIATTKRSGSEIGRAFRSIILNLQQVSGEFDGEVIDEEQLKKLEARCHSMGVELEYMKDGITTLRNPIEVLKELAEVYNSLPDNSADKQGLISDLGGKYHANALSALLSRWDLYEKMLSEFSQGAGSALEEAEKTANSWEGSMNRLQNSFDSFINTLTNKEAIMGGISFFDRLIQGAETLTDTIGEIPVVLTTLNTAMTAMKKDYGITQLVNPETKELDIQGNLMGIDFSAIKEQKKHFLQASEEIKYWNKELRSGKADLDSFSGSLVKNNAQFKAYLQTTSKDAPASLAGYKTSLNAAGISTDALRLKTILLNSAISMGIGIAIQAAVQGIAYLIQREEELRQATKEAAEAYKDSASSIDDYASKYQELHKALVTAKGNEEETYNIKKQLLELQTELNDKFGEEYGKINLVTDAYKDQTEAIKALNKEAAQTFLNENKEGIDKSVIEMTKDRHYNLSYTGMVSTTDKGSALKEIAEKYKDQGVSILDEGDGGVTFSVHLNADAQSAYDTINAFETDLRNKAIELGDEHMFDDVLDISSGSLNQAKDTIGEYGEIYKQALTAELVADDNKSKVYNEALRAVEAYNDAVLKSENPYDDQNVTQAKASLDTIKDTIQGNKEEWEKYSTLFDDVFSQADTRLIEFNEALKTDDGIKELANDLEGLSDVDLQALDDNAGENNSFDKLKEAAKGYDVSVSELIDTLIRLGYIQGEIQSTVVDTTESIPATISSSIQQIATQLEPQFAKLGEAYQEIFKLDDNGKEKFSLDSIDNSMLESLRQTFAEIESKVGVAFDSSKLEPFFDTLTNGNSTAEQVRQAFNELATAYLYSTDTLEQLNAETADAIEKQLEEMGVQNAAEIVADALTAKTEELIVAKEYLAQTGKDLASATEEERTAFILEQIEAGNCGEALALLQLKKILVNQSTITTAAECQNILALAQAANIGIQQLQQLQTLMNMITQRDAAVQSGDSRAVSELNRAIREFSANVVSNINLDDVQVDFGNIGGGKSAASKSGKEAGDAYVDAFEKELERLKTLRDQGKITEKQYLDYLRKLYQKFFKDKKKYAEQYAKYEHEYLQGMKSLYESALSGITSMLDKQISAYEDSKSAAVESLEAQRDAAIEAKEAEKERYEQEIELIDKQIAAKEKAIQKIRDEIDAMETANADRKMALNLQLDEYNLQRQLNQKTKLIYTEDGFKYDIDTSGLREAKQKVEDDKLEIAIANKEKEIKLIEKEIDLLENRKSGINENIDLLDKQIDQINDYYDKLIADTEKYWDNLISGIQDYKSRWEELGEIEENAKVIETLQALGIEVDDVLGMSEEAFSKFKDEYVGILADIYSGNDSMLSALSDTTGRSVDQMGSYLDSTQGYIDSLSGIGDSLNPLAESIGNVEESMGTLSTTASEADENISSAAGSVDSVNTSLGETATTTDTVATNVGTVVDGLNQLPENGKVSGLAGEFETLATKIGEVAKALGIGEGEAVSTLFQAMNSLNDVTLGNEGEGIIGQFTLLKNAITDVIETIGSTEAQTVGSLMSAIAQLNSISLDESIIAQFTNLKTAIDSVTAAISGGGGESSEGEGSGGGSGSSGGKQGSKGGKGGKGSQGKGESGGGNSLTGAIEQMGETAKEVIGEPDAEGDGTVIGEFGSMETAVNDVRDAIGTEGSAGGEGGKSASGGKGESDDTLVGSIEYLGDKTEEEMGESGGDGIIGRFEEFRDVIGQADEHVKSISDGLDEIDGKEVSCTIHVNIETSGSTGFTGSAQVLGSMNLNSADYNAQYTGNAHYEGTAEVTGDWGVKKGGTTLVGELGQELVVFPNGRFRTVGDNGAEFVDIPANSIVFNHLQTKELLSKGNIVGRGRALASGTALANGTSNNADDSIWTTLADGSKVRPLQPGDKMYDLVQKFDAYFKSMDGNLEKLVPNSFYEHQRQMEDMAKQINYVSSITNNNRNTQPVVNHINVTCPGVTSQQVAEQLGNVLGKELDKQFSGFHNYTDQRSRIR